MEVTYVHVPLNGLHFDIKKMYLLCILIYFVIFNLGVGALVVSVDLSDETLVLFNRSGNIGNKWLEAEVYIKKLDAPFQV